MLLKAGVTINRLHRFPWLGTETHCGPAHISAIGNAKATFAVGTGEYGRIFPTSAMRGTGTYSVWRSNYVRPMSALERIPRRLILCQFRKVVQRHCNPNQFV